MSPTQTPQPVLVAYDGSSTSHGTLRAALAVLQPAPLIILTVWTRVRSNEGPRQRTPADARDRVAVALDAEAEDAAMTIARQGAEVATASGWQAVPETAPAAPSGRLGERSRWHTISSRAEAADVSVLVVGGAGRAGAMIMGRTTYALVHRSAVPVLVVPPGAAVGTGPLVAAYDGSDHARFAVEAAAHAIRSTQAVVLSVWRSVRPAADAARIALPDAVVREGLLELERTSEHDARRRAEQGAAHARDVGLNAEPLSVRAERSVAGAIVGHARAREAPAIVVGTRGRSELTSLLLGSVAWDVLARADRPVLVAPFRAAGQASRSATR
jgi:nucleotide-binding universal stress UspA family protein